MGTSHSLINSIGSGYNKSTTFSMEAAKTVANEELTTNVAGVTITPLTNIRLEIKLFSAVLNLKESPLRNVILNPSLMAEFPEPRKAQKFDYKGYVCFYFYSIHYISHSPKFMKSMFRIFREA